MPARGAKRNVSHLPTAQVDSGAGELTLTIAVQSSSVSTIILFRVVNGLVVALTKSLREHFALKNAHGKDNALMARIVFP